MKVYLFFGLIISILTACNLELTPEQKIIQQKQIKSSTVSQDSEKLIAEESFFWDYNLYYQNKELGSGRTRIIHTDDGNLFVAGVHPPKIPAEHHSVLALTHLSKNGVPLWKKGFIIEPNFNLRSLIEHQDHLYISGYTQPSPTRSGVTADKSANSVNAILLKLNKRGSVLWSKQFNMEDRTQGFSNSHRLKSLSPDELVLTDNNWLIFLNSEGEELRKKGLSGPIADIVKTSSGSFLVTHRVILEKIVEHGFQLSKLKANLKTEWYRNYAQNIQGRVFINLSNLHPIGPQRYFMGFSIDDRRNISPGGLASIVLNEEGEVQLSNLHRTKNKVRGFDLNFTQLYGSFATSDEIFLNAMHTAGGKGVDVRMLLISRYSKEGQLLDAQRSSQTQQRHPLEGTLSVQEGQLIYPAGVHNSEKGVSFRIARDSLEMNLCEKNWAEFNDSPDFKLQVEDKIISTQPSDNHSLPTLLQSSQDFKEIPLNIKLIKTTCQNKGPGTNINLQVQPQATKPIIIEVENGTKTAGTVPYPKVEKREQDSIIMMFSGGDAGGQAELKSSGLTGKYHVYANWLNFADSPELKIQLGQDSLNLPAGSQRNSNGKLVEDNLGVHTLNLTEGQSIKLTVGGQEQRQTKAWIGLDYLRLEPLN